MKQFTITEAANIVGVARSTVQRKIKTGELSKNGSGKIDLSELLRVFPQSEYDYHQQTTQGEDKQSGQNSNTANAENQFKDEMIQRLKSEIEELKNDKAFLQDELKKASDHVLMISDQSSSETFFSFIKKRFSRNKNY